MRESTSNSSFGTAATSSWIETSQGIAVVSGTTVGSVAVVGAALAFLFVMRRKASKDAGPREPTGVMYATQDKPFGVEGTTASKPFAQPATQCTDSALAELDSDLQLNSNIGSGAQPIAPAVVDIDTVNDINEPGAQSIDSRVV